MGAGFNFKRKQRSDMDFNSYKNTMRELLQDIILSTTKSIPVINRFGFYKLLIEHFSFYGFGDFYSCTGLDEEFDKALQDVYPTLRVYSDVR